MNPSAKAAGLSFQLFQTSEADDDRLHDKSPNFVCTEVRPYPDCEMLYPTTAYLPEPRKHSVIKDHSRFSGESPRVPLSGFIVSDDGGFPMGYLTCGFDSSSPLKREASSEQPL